MSNANQKRADAGADIALSQTEKWVLDKLYKHRDERDCAVNLLERVVDKTTGITREQRDYLLALSKDTNDKYPVLPGEFPTQCADITISSRFLVAMLTDDFTPFASRSDAVYRAEAAALKHQSLVIDIGFAVIHGCCDLEDSLVNHEIELKYCVFDDEVKCSNCRFTSHFGLQGCVFNRVTSNPNDDPSAPTAFDNMNVGGGLFLDKSVFAGPVALCSTHVAADLSAEGVQFNGIGQRDKLDMYNCGLNLKDIQVDGTLSLRGARIAGPATLSNAKIGKNLIASDAVFACREAAVADTDFPYLKEYALQCVDLDIGGSFDLQKATISGNATFESSRAGRRFEITPAYFKGSHISFGDVTVGNELVLGGSLFASTCNYEIGGLKYEAITNGVAGDDKLLSFVDSADFNQAAYAELEKYFDELGRTDMANRVYFKRNIRQLGQFGWSVSGLLLKSRNLLLLVFVGYGRYPVLAVLYSILIVFFGTRVFRHERDMTVTREGEGKVAYSPFWYSLSLYLPVAELEASRYWRPKYDPSETAPKVKRMQTWRMNYMRIHILLGWLIVPIGLASVSGLIK
jgi:hypothetical protein